MMWSAHSSCVVLALGVLGCAHAPLAASRFVSGRPSEYRLAVAGDVGSMEEFASRVRRLQAQALAARPKRLYLSVEITDAQLRQSLVNLAAEPTAENHRLVATHYLRVRVTDVAADHFSAAIVLNPRDAAAYEMRARIWRDWGFPENGLADAYRAVYHAADSPTCHNTLGTVFHRLHRWKDARAEYERAVHLDPSAVYARVNLCSLDLIENRLADAIESCGRAVALDSRSALARRNLDYALSSINAAALEARNVRD